MGSGAIDSSQWLSVKEETIFLHDGLIRVTDLAELPSEIGVSEQGDTEQEVGESHPWYTKGFLWKVRHTDTQNARMHVPLFQLCYSQVSHWVGVQPKVLSRAVASIPKVWGMWC